MGDDDDDAARAVLPAQAGVFLDDQDLVTDDERPPRAGGGLPPSAITGKLGIESSPRRRGSSLRPNGGGSLRDVLPAQAGVFPSYDVFPGPLIRPPRAGGGLPAMSLAQMKALTSSPRRRGSSGYAGDRRGAGRVLPAQAGVFQRFASSRRRSPSPPRAGGGLPYVGHSTYLVKASSPRRRGSSGLQPRHDLPRLVLPAQAGVFRGDSSWRCRSSGPPRAGGGLPVSGGISSRTTLSSPRRRGSSPGRGLGDRLPGVLPAQAGVFQRGCLPLSLRRSPPRAGGGLPDRGAYLIGLSESSPRRRGSSGALAGRGPASAVLPAQAGVFRGGGSSRRSGTGPPRAGGGLPL